MYVNVLPRCLDVFMKDQYEKKTKDCLSNFILNSEIGYKYSLIDDERSKKRV